jgi:hypothetical protein
MKDFPYMEPLEHGSYEVFLFPTPWTKRFKEGATPKGVILFEGLAMRVVAPISQAQGEYNTSCDLPFLHITYKPNLIWLWIWNVPHGKRKIMFVRYFKIKNKT